jgi:hypothetical protein
VSDVTKPDEAKEALLQACKLVLLFHSGSHWTFEKQQEWVKGMHALITTNNPVVVGANEDGTWDRNAAREDVTTKNLCNAVRAAIAKAERST